MARRIVPLLILSTLAACAPDASSPPAASGAAGADAAAPADPAPAAQAMALTVEAEGLRLVDPASGSARPIPFGTPRALVMIPLASRGAAETGTNAECGAGPLAYARWPDGLTLWFQEGAFAGWALNAPAPDAPPSPAGGISTASGLTVGNGQTSPSTRADLDSAYAATVEQSTLGTEFAAGELYGLLDGEGSGAKVTALWAGVSCNFR
jgi:hypothetical protein